MGWACLIAALQALAMVMVLRLLTALVLYLLFISSACVSLTFLQHLGLLKDWRPVTTASCIQPPCGSTAAAGTEGGQVAGGSDGGGRHEAEGGSSGGEGVEVESDVAVIEAVLG